MAEDNQSPENQSGVTLEQLKQLLGEFEQKMNDSLTSAIVKQKKAVDQRFTTLDESLGTAIKEQMTSVLSKVIPDSEVSGEKTPLTEDAAAKQQLSDEDPTAKLQAMIEQQNQQFEKRLSETEKQYENRIKAMQDAVDQERLNTAKSNARNAALDPIRDRLHNPELAWAYLESQGVTYNAEKGYGVPGQDEFQNPTFIPLSNRLSNLEKEAAYLFKPRPGNGTGTQPSQGSQGGTSNSSAYATDSKVQAADRFEAVKKSADPIADIVANATAS